MFRLRVAIAREACSSSCRLLVSGSRTAGANERGRTILEFALALLNIALTCPIRRTTDLQFTRPSLISRWYQTRNTHPERAKEYLKNTFIRSGRRRDSVDRSTDGKTSLDLLIYELVRTVVSQYAVVLYFEFIMYVRPAWYTCRCSVKNWRRCIECISTRKFLLETLFVYLVNNSVSHHSFVPLLPAILCAKNIHNWNVLFQQIKTRIHV